MKYFVVFSLIFCLSPTLWAEAKLQDVPEGHWATEAVYGLVKMGITTGYPDGTFRGRQNISRYEMASFLSRFTKYFKRLRGQREKLVEELKSEIALLRYKREKAEEETQFSGVIESRARVSPIEPRGGKTDYRLKLDLIKNFAAGTSLKMSLDTVDAGFNTDSSRAFATKLVEIESKFKLAGLSFVVNLGPGVVPHTEDFFPCEKNTIYIRPKTAIKASASVAKMDFSASYVTRQVETSGKIGVHEFTGKIKYDFGRWALHFRPRYLFKIDGPRDILAELGIDFYPEKSWETNLFLSAGSFQDGQSGIYVKLIEKIKDPWKTGTDLVLRFDKVGSQYRIEDLDEYEFVYLNNFSRLILDGTADIGLKLDQRLSDKLSLEWKGDYVTTGDYQYGEAYPETYLLWQLNLSYDFSSKVEISAFYRSYNVPSGTAQFSDPVPKISELLGIGLKCGF